MDARLIRRLCFWAIGTTTIVFALALASIYFYMRQQLIVQAEYDAKRDLDIASSLIYDRLGIARTALVNSVVPETVGDSKRIVENLLRHNDDIYGTAIAIKPEFANKYLSKERYMVYSHRTAADTLNTFVLSDSVNKYFHYPERDWYKYPMDNGKGHWTEPYYDSLTTGELMVSYSTPIYLSDSTLVGVLLADITLKEGISSIVQDIDSASDYRTYLLSKDSLLVFGDTTNIADNVVLTKLMPETGWTIGHAIDKHTLFEPLYSAMLNLAILFVLTIIILCFTIYYTIHWMTRPAVKKQMRIAAELDIAARIQEGMLPKMIPPFKDCKDLNIATVMQPAKEVGGDFYNYFMEDNRLYFIIGDVSGKGVPAALFMSITTELFMVSAPGKLDPAQIVGNINNVLTRDNQENMFVTMIVGILDIPTAKLRLCNAGHNMPISITSDHPQMLRLETNIPTGVIDDYAYVSEEFDFPAGSTLVLYTDGVTEAENAKHEQYGDARLMDTVAANRHATTQDLCSAIESDVHSFTAGYEQSDDITLFVLKFFPT